MINFFTKSIAHNRVSEEQIYNVKTVFSNSSNSSRYTKFKTWQIAFLFACALCAPSLKTFAQCTNTGTGIMCVGTTAPLTGTPSGGTWTSANTSIATVSGSGLVTGVNNGTAVISYHSGGCWATNVVTVNVTPAAIGGPTSVCTGSTITLTNSVTGGIWSCTSPHVSATPSGSNYLVTGSTVGTAIVTYTKGTGINACSVYSTITVNATPSPISGTPLPPVCAGSTLSVSDPTPSGTWSSASTGIATVSGSVITGVSNGTSVISYTVGSCSATTVVTINTSPAAIGGPTSVCTGSTITLTNSVAGGTWQCTASAVSASVSSGNYLVTGITAGTATITYTVGTGINACSVYSTITVNATPSAINGTPLPPVCAGSTLTISDPTGGGTWSSGSTGIATISSGGVITGVSNGTSVISYTVGSCSATTVVTINTSPAAIGGPTSVCTGSIITLTDAVGSGGWTTTSSDVYAAISSGNYVITGLTAGTATVTYTIGAGINACSIYSTITVNATPLPIDGVPISPVCVGNTITMTDPTGGGTWSSVSTSVATITSGGVLTGVSGGTSIISYTLGSCAMSTVVTVNPVPTISGTGVICAGGSITLSNSISGGSWTSVSDDATVGAGTGIVTGVYSDTVTIVYTLPTGCFATAIVTVNDVPGAISGVNFVCTGATITLSDDTLFGTWSSGNIAIATVNPTGVLTGIAYGIVSITYSTGCGSAATLTITVSAQPSVISGSNIAFVGFTDTLTDSIPYGTWSSGTTSIATINPTGVLMGINVGFVTITYSTGCGTDALGGIHIYELPGPPTCAGCGTITGLPDTIYKCRGSNDTLVWGWDTTTAPYVLSHYSWSPTTGITIADTAGTIPDTTIFIVPGGCTTYSLTVTALGPNEIENGNFQTGGLPIGSSASFTSGYANDCAHVGLSAKYCICANPHSVWSITEVCSFYDHTLGTSAGYMMMVNGDTTAGTNLLNGTLNLCCQKKYHFSMWLANWTTPESMTYAASIKVSINGISYGSFSPGDADCGVWHQVGFDFTTDSCSGDTTVQATLIDLNTEYAGNDFAIDDIAVQRICTTVDSFVLCPYIVGAITVDSLVCIGETITLADTSLGGIWTITDSAIAHIDSTTGIVTGVSTGIDTVTYTSTRGCSVTQVITVNLPPENISGVDSVCFGSTITLTDTGTGTWSGSNLLITAVGSGTGIVTGVGVGTDSITYSISTGCYAIMPFTVNPLPAAILGDSFLCVGVTVTFSDSISGGTWSAGNSHVTIGSSTGIVTSVSVGYDTITYSLSTGCFITKVITVNPLPVVPPITGIDSICYGASTTLYDSLHGGTWSSTSSIISVTSSPDSAVIHATGSGTAVVTYTYTNSNGCTSFVTDTIFIDSAIVVSPIYGVDSICSGATFTLYDSTSGGVWSTIFTTDFTVGSTTGVIVAVGTGTLPEIGGSIIYTITDAFGCKDSAFHLVVIDSFPVIAPIYGIDTLCVHTNVTLHDSTASGTWSSGNTTIATIGSGTGIVWGTSAGIDTITYTVSHSGCSSQVTYIINVLPKPSVPPIMGPDTMCVQTSITLTDSAAGGTWLLIGSGAVAHIIYTDGDTCVVFANSLGTVTLSYTVSGGGCDSTVIDTIYVVGYVSISPITGSDSICVGSTDTLSDTASGGTWSVGASTSATISSSGVLTGIAPGVVVVTYTYNYICGSQTVYDTVHIFPLPEVGPILGTDTVCTGILQVYTDSFPGGTWTLSDSTIAHLNFVTGHFIGTAPGTDTIFYTIGSVMCGIADTYKVVTILPNPALDSITGDSIICVGSIDTLHFPVTGGTWSVTPPGFAIIDSVTGIMTTTTAGIDTVFYHIHTYCGNFTFHYIVNVFPYPIVTPIRGRDSICVGQSGPLVDSVTGGIWTSGNTTVATIDSFSGLVTGVSAGTDTISYTMTGPGGCSTTVTFLMTVDSLPVVAAITGLDSVCIGSTITLTDGTTGGVWVSGNSAIATVDSFGHVTGITAGTDTISYAVTNALGCTSFAFFTVTVVAPPAVTPITGATYVCLGGTLTLTESSTGFGTVVWSSSNTTIATISSTGVVTGLSVGVDTITYTITNLCGTASTTKTITVEPLPSISPITGDTVICLGATVTLTDATTGGSWFSPGDGTIVQLLGGGVVKGIGGGTTFVTYSTSTAYCTSYAKISFTVITAPVVPPITGILGVCSGYTDTLSDTAVGGTWSSSNTGIATVGSSTGIVTGISTGIVTISYTVTNACGTTIVTTNVSVNMPPYITTNTIVACQTLAVDTSRGGTVHILPGTGCVDVCDSSVVRYYANGVAGSIFTWNIVGGTIVATYPPDNDSIDVLWSTVGLTGNITLYDTFSHCIGMTSTCIQVIAKPEALFSILPSLTAATGVVNICDSTTVLFNDLSTADSTSPIISWYWNFGDGNFAFTRNPSHEFFMSGYDTVSLVVTNACGCTDTYKVVLNIYPHPGPVITCASIVCDSAVATYSTTPDTCGIYNWSVIGGTVVAGGTTSSSTISVVWNGVGTGGYGYVSLAEPCTGICNDTTTIRIPVITHNAAISGPDTICIGQQYEYQLPLWGSTRYQWGVLNNPSAVVGYNNDYKLIVQFSTTGIDTIHAWYQNELELCGGNVFKTIYVRGLDTISGIKLVCVGSTENYTLTTGHLAKWILTDPTGVSTNLGTSIATSTTFTLSGAYLLSASGNFCADPITIIVNPLPPDVDSITGADTICLNRVYRYVAHHDVAGAIYNWTATGGSVSPTTGDTVTVVWSAGTIHQLSVYRVSTDAPYCVGNTFTKNIVPDTIKVHFTGDTSVCANSLDTYSCNYFRGELYDWAIYPPTAGSVVAGNHNPNITAEWNNTTTDIYPKIVVTIHRCDSIKRDTLTVHVHPSPVITINAAPLTACPGETITFTATSGDETYNWNFGDGISAATTTNIEPYAFPPNVTTSNLNYVVTVTGIPGAGFGCPAVGTAAVVVAIKPGPIAYASTATIQFCGTFSEVITGTATDNVGSISYAWNTGASTSTITVTDFGSYYFTATGSNGCSAVSNIVLISNSCDSTSPPPCGLAIGATSTHICDAIYLYGTCYSTGVSEIGSWIPEVTPEEGTLPSGAGTITATATYDVPGVYHFTFHVYSSTLDCAIDSNLFDTVGIVPNFKYRLRCAEGSADSLYLIDVTSYLPMWTIDSIIYSISGTTIGITGLGEVLPDTLTPGSYTITETVVGMCPDGHFSCTTSETIIVPNRPSPEFTDSLSPICENVPIQFTYTGSGGIANYDWSFGDGSSILLANPERTYSWSPTADPRPDTVKLVITDTIGCKDSTTNIVDIYENLLNGVYTGGGAICASAVPDVITFVSTGGGASPFNYLWSNGLTGSSVNIYASGSYWVTVSDAHQCQFTKFAAKNVRVITPPTPTITGKQNYCLWDSIKLNGFAGYSPPLIYKWYKNGTHLVGTGYTYSGFVYSVDSIYDFTLKIGIVDSATGDTCYSTSAIDTLHVYPLPPAPVITDTVINCNSYSIDLIATDAESGTYNWSDGHTGAVDGITSGGPYEVWFTNLQGCKSTSSILVPQSPAWYAQYLATGCYTICKQQLPLTLYGPPDVSFTHWDWIGSSPVDSGSGRMGTYNIDTSGTYGWSLNTGLCSQDLGYMDITVVGCDSCQGWVVIPTITCTPSDPASYQLSVFIADPVTGTTTFTIGTDMGPVLPFTGSITGNTTFTMTYTTFATTFPDSINLEVEFTLPDGVKCFKKVPVILNSCEWEAERHGGNIVDSQHNSQNVISSAMMVAPNPATNTVTISYDYGNDGKTGRDIVIYNQMGQRMQYTEPQNTNGTWTINVQDWVSGIYLIRMDGDGKALQMQKLVVSH